MKHWKPSKFWLGYNTALLIVLVFLLLSRLCHGATIFMESGTDATQDFSFWSSTSGTVTSDSTSPITGPRSIKLSTGSPAVTAFVRKLSCLADAGRRISFRFKTDNISPSAATNIVRVLNAAVSGVFVIRLNTDGTLGILAGGVGGGSESIALKANTPYRIGISYVITSTTVWTINLYINGVLQVSLSNAATLSATTGIHLEHTVASTAGINTNFWIDDVYVDDGSDLLDPGNIIVTNKRPNANGAANGFTTQIGSGGSGYGTGHSPQVNEQPLSTTNGWSIASASALTEEYTIENSATGDVNLSGSRYNLVDYMGWIYAKTASAGTRNIVLAGAATNISTTTSYALYTKIGASTTYPSTNAAIGMNNNSVNNLTSLAECGILLAYKLPRRVSVNP